MGTYYVFYNLDKKEWFDPSDINDSPIKADGLETSVTIGNVLTHLLVRGRWKTVAVTGDSWPTRSDEPCHDEITHDKVHPKEPSNGWTNISKEVIADYNANLEDGGELLEFTDSYLDEDGEERDYDPGLMYPRIVRYAIPLISTDGKVWLGTPAPKQIFKIERMLISDDSPTNELTKMTIGDRVVLESMSIRSFRASEFYVAYSLGVIDVDESVRVELAEAVRGVTILATLLLTDTSDDNTSV